jgi:2-dehydro-3-deoxyphosphogluconate aldolase / (4S)-4-hydroxy-2-oxoglutarate aldolase
MIETPQSELAAILSLVPVIPVVVIEDAGDAISLAQALVRGGLRVIEVTLRTDAALPAIAAMSGIEGAIVGAGTVLNRDQLVAALQAGARFAVSPGATDSLVDAADGLGVPLLPGVATASEALALIERGYRFAKFFPAEPLGGVPMLRALASPLPQLQFCPTGGISPGNALSYLALPNVICVGGSWMVSASALARRDWAEIEEQSRLAASWRSQRAIS